MAARYVIRFYGVVLLLVLTVATQGQIKCKIEHYSTEDGLSHNGVTSIIKSSDGFMWFGTWDGINRFDGHNFVTYKSHPGDSSGLKSNRIDRIVEDYSGFLWLRPYDNEITRFDKKTGKLLSIPDILARANISNIRFDKVIPASGEKVWLTTIDQGVFCVRKAASASPEIIRYAKGMPGGFQLPSDVINFLHVDQMNNVWLGTDMGLTCLKEDKAGIYKKINISPDNFAHQGFIAVAEDKDRTWFGTDNGVLIFYEKAFKKFSSKKISGSRLNAFCLSKKAPVIYASTSTREIITTNTSSLKSDMVSMPGDEAFYSMYEDRSGLLWIEPEVNGIVKYNPVSKTFKYFSQKTDATLNNSVKLFGVFEDNENRVWVGMARGGFGYYNPVNDEVEYFYNQPGSANRKFSNIVGVRYFDPSGVLWFTTSDRGFEKVIFQRKDLDPKLLVDVTSNKTDNEIRGIYNDNKNRIWLASKSGDVFIQQADGKRLTNLFVNEPAGGIGLVYTILQDRNGKMWLGTKGNGLYSAEPVDSNAVRYKLTHYRSDKNDIYSISSDLIYSLLQDKNGRIWVGTFENGLNLVINNGDQLKFINAKNHFKSYPNALAGKIRHLQQDANGRLWIGTTNGLLITDINKPNYKGYQFLSYRKTPGDKTSLSNNDLQFIFKDSKNRMWLSTSGGGLNQATVNKNNELQFKVFTRKDGLPSDYIVSIVEDSHGNLWLGTENGLCKFNPDKILFRNYDSYDGLMKAAFSEASGLRLANGNLLFGTLNGYLIFNPSTLANNKISADMAFTNLQVNNKDLVTGVDESPLKVDINNTGKIELKHNENIISIDFTILDFRSNDKQTYAYRLKNFDKDWNNVVNQHKATYTNLPPGKYVFEVKSLSEDLYENLPIKTLDITILPPWWRTWWAYLVYAVLLVVLIEIVRRVITTMIRLRNKVVVERKLTDLKIKFFTNISHELRTPLTLIINPIDEVIKQNNLSARSYEYLNVARKNTNRMVRFINQLLDFQKVQNKKMGLKIAQTEMVTFVKDISSYFTEAANEKQIELLVSSNVDVMPAWVDAEKMDIVIYNLLSNAFKFSPKGKRIEIVINHVPTSDHFTVSVIDEGIGVPADKLHDIFELYYEVDKPETDHLAGTGIGLALSKEIVQLHHGKIYARNNAANGLTVSVELWTGKEHFKKGDAIILTPPRMLNAPKEMAEAVRFPRPGSIGETATVASEDAPVVLVVDDNTELRNFLADQLKPYYRVIEAENGKDGLEKANQSLPDLVLSDVMMPEMNGIELLDKLKNNITTSHIPVILLTAKSSVDSQIEGLSYGADYYITKPFHANLILALIGNLLKQRRKIFETLLSGNGQIALKKEVIQEETEEEVPLPLEISITAKDETFLKKVIAIVEHGMEDPQFNIDRVAESLLMGRTTFYKKLKSLTNLAPVEFIREVRLKRGKELLDEEETNISTIAYAVGFSNAKYFSTCFREKYNMSPSEYLKQKKAENKTSN
ncbi:MAG: two-component regulator propeller domain-containing protein [Ferruginibacter sp.]